MSKRLGFLAIRASLPLLLCASAVIAEESGPASAQLVSTVSKGIRVLIRSIDSGPILWDAPLKPATKATAVPGEHQISVMCQIQKSGMMMTLPGTMTLMLEAGRTYDIFGEASPDNRRCVPTAVIRP